MEECYICFENKNKLFKICKICKKELCADCINKIVKDNDIFFENNEKDIKFVIKCPNCRSNNNHNFRLNEMKMKLIMNKINKLEEENKILKNKINLLLNIIKKIYKKCDNIIKEMSNNINMIEYINKITDIIKSVVIFK